MNNKDAIANTPIVQRVSLALLFLRIGVFIAMMIWVIDKFAQPDHTAAVFQAFYGISGIGTVVAYLLGIAELLIMVGVVLGIQK